MSLCILALLLTIASPLLAEEAPPLFPLQSPQPFPDGASSFEEARRLILDKYYSDRIDENSLWWAAVRGMLRQVSPPQDPERATLWPPTAYERVADSLRGVTHSSGLQSSFNAADGSLTVTSIEPGSPADGLLQPWDRILRIEGEPLKGLDATELDTRLRGESGQSVHLTVVRDVQVLEVELSFRVYQAPLIDVQELPGDVLYVRLRSLSLGVATALPTALGAPSADDQEPRRVVLDLRDNGGGLLNEAVDIVNIFVPKDELIVTTKGKVRDWDRSYKTNGNPLDLEIPVAVLINDRSASASE